MYVVGIANGASEWACYRGSTEKEVKGNRRTENNNPVGMPVKIKMFPKSHNLRYIKAGAEKKIYYRQNWN